MTVKAELSGFHIRTFDALNIYELYEIFRARADIFTSEEKILYPDADGIDYDCIHVFRTDRDGKVTAYLRMFSKPGEKHVIQMGRVLTREHGRGLGKSSLKPPCRLP